MGLKWLWQRVAYLWKSSVTLEPIIVIYTFAAFVLDGSKITTNLLITKICESTNFDNVTEEVGVVVDCSNLTWVAEQDVVMTEVNDFQVKCTDDKKYCDA